MNNQLTRESVNDEQLELGLEDQEEYSKLLVRLVDGSTMKGTIESTKRLADDVNDSSPFLVMHDAVCRLAEGKGFRQKVIYVNKKHILWAVPA
jgi:small nuclear ribonucleoprotein (snRNP)-like protein